MKQSINMLAAELAKAKRTHQKYASKHFSLMTEATQYQGYMEETQSKIDDGGAQAAGSQSGAGRAQRGNVMSITWQERKAFQEKLESYTNEQVLEAYAYERAMHRWPYAAIARVELELRGLKN